MEPSVQDCHQTVLDTRSNQRENRPSHTSPSAIQFISILEIQNHWRKAFGIANEINRYLALPITRNIASSCNNVLKSKPNGVNSPSFRSKEAVKTAVFQFAFRYLAIPLILLSPGKHSLPLPRYTCNPVAHRTQATPPVPGSAQPSLPARSPFPKDSL